MKKNNKAEAVMKLLNKGYPAKEIITRIAVSASYVSMLKKKMAHKAEEEKVEKLAEVKAAAAEEAKAKEVDAILDQRANQYGNFMFSANIAVRLKGVMHNAIAQQDLPVAPDQLLALDMIAVKISRILSGNPSHRDSWIDIAGYAKLVADRLEGKIR
jgi:transposase